MKLNVGKIRQAIQGLSDDAEINIVWKDGPPSDDQPGVEIFGFDKGVSKGRHVLEIEVGLFYLEEEEEEEEY